MRTSYSRIPWSGSKGRQGNWTTRETVAEDDRLSDAPNAGTACGVGVILFLVQRPRPLVTSSQDQTCHGFRGGPGSRRCLRSGPSSNCVVESARRLQIHGGAGEVAAAVGETPVSRSNVTSERLMRLGALRQACRRI